MEINSDPLLWAWRGTELALWAWSGTALALVTFLSLLARTFSDHLRILGEGWGKRLTVLTLSIVALICFAAAGWNPQIVDRLEPDTAHLVIVMDVSDSLQRATGGWEAVRDAVAEWVSNTLSNTQTTTLERGQGTILTFGRTVRTLETVSLGELENSISRVERADLAPGDSTRIAEALTAAGQILGQSGGRGAIVLISDGNQTAPGAEEAAQELAQRGIPIYVLPKEGAMPALAIVAANLPRRIAAEDTTYLRGVMANTSSNDISAQITIAQNSEVLSNTGRAGPSKGITGTASLPSGNQVHLRQPLRFEGLGIQLVDLVLSDSQEPGNAGHTRRFFTHVVQPPRILAVRGDNRWIAALSPDSATIEQISPEELDKDALENVDAVVISGVYAKDFPSGVLAELAHSVEKNGTGLMIINGDHGGQSEETETVLMSYIDTPLEPLLPVSSRPRPFTPQPPPRNVVIVMDASGSMAGWRLEISKAIASHLISTFLRPQDHLDIIPFTTHAYFLVENQSVTDAAKGTILSRLDTIQANGGTDPKEAFRLIANREFKDCGVVFISDGEFNAVTYRPDCRATVFAIGHSQQSIPQTLRDLGDSFPVGEGFSPSNIQIPYFEAKPRDKFFEPGEYRSLSMLEFVRAERRLPVPSLPLLGNAVSYAKENVDLIAVRPKLTDPILAYRQAQAGYVGVFTTGFPDAWIEDAEGKAAIEAWMLRLIPYLARDRYDFQLDDRGEGIDIRISLQNSDGTIPNVDRLFATLEITDGPSHDISLTPIVDEPAVFSGQIRIPRTQTQTGFLILREDGSQALPRPQRVPILVPPAVEIADALSDEDMSYGINEALLRQLADAGGGEYDPPTEFVLFQQQAQRPDPFLLWSWLLVIGAVAYVGAIAAQRLMPDRR